MTLSRWSGVLGFIVLLAFGLPAQPVQAQSVNSRALETCVKTAIRQLMLFKTVVSQKDIRDLRGTIIGAQIVMDVNFLGKDARMNCIYDAAKATAIVEPYRPPPTVPAVTPPPPGVPQQECIKAVQKQALMMDRVISASDVLNSRKERIGRTFVMAVYQKGKPVQVTCTYDFASKATALQLNRPQPR